MIKKILILTACVFMLALAGVSAAANSSSQKVVLFAMDDFQTWWLDSIQSSIVQVHIDNNIPVTLGVIPAGIADPDGAAPAFIAKIQKWNTYSNIDVAQHGYDHIPYLADEDYNTQLSQITTGNNLMKSIGVSPKSFIPPFGSANLDTVNILKTLGFHSLYNPIEMTPTTDSNLLIIQDQITLTKDGDEGSSSVYVDYNTLKSEVDQKISQYGVALVLYHMQDFNKGTEDSPIFDTYKAGEIVNYSSQLKKDGYTLMTVEQYYQYLHAPAIVCGNNKTEGTEVCDGTNLNGKTCATQLGTGYTGTLSCNSLCTFNTTLCVAPITQVCGNNKTEGTEVCDNNSQACTINGYAGTQACNSLCNGWNTCVTNQSCGNSIIDGTEQCDLGALNTNTACTALYGSSCSYCSTSCKNITVQGPRCGDNTLQVNETCDGTNLNSNTCASILGTGYTGTLTCNSLCTFNTALCVSPVLPKCGDNLVNQANETCDGTNLNGKTCATQLGTGYTGTLSCNSLCTFNTALCVAPITQVCGNSILEGTEQCDKGTQNGVICLAGYGKTCSYCSSQCQTVTVKGAYCGDKVCSGGENCVTCSSDCGTCFSKFKFWWLR